MRPPVHDSATATVIFCRRSNRPTTSSNVSCPSAQIHSRNLVRTSSANNRRTASLIDRWALVVSDTNTPVGEARSPNATGVRFRMSPCSFVFTSDSGNPQVWKINRVIGRERPDFARSSWSAKNGMTDFCIMACISLGTPGSAITCAFRHVSAKPGADPTGLGNTVARDGIKACRNCPRFGVRPHWANLALIPSNASLRRASRKPVTDATASLVQSSTVGPKPPVMITIPARRQAVIRTPAMSDWSSPTMVLNLTSMPIAAKASATNSELLSDRPPMSSSEPIAIVSAVYRRGTDILVLVIVIG